MCLPLCAYYVIYYFNIINILIPRETSFLNLYRYTILYPIAQVIKPLSVDPLHAPLHRSYGARHVHELQNIQYKWRDVRVQDLNYFSRVKLVRWCNDMCTLLYNINRLLTGRAREVIEFVIISRQIKVLCNVKILFTAQKIPCPANIHDNLPHTFWEKEYCLSTYIYICDMMSTSISRYYLVST